MINNIVLYYRARGPLLFKVERILSKRGYPVPGARNPHIRTLLAAPEATRFGLVVDVVTHCYNKSAGKFLSQLNTLLFWSPCRPLRNVTDREQEKAMYVSQHHTRCEQWSTLREMLPSRGRAEPMKQPNWGTSSGVPPSLVGTRASRFPVYDSEMTRSARAHR